MRIWLVHQGQAEVNDSVGEVIALEDADGLETCAAYSGFQQRAEKVKFSLLEYLLTAKSKDECLVGYGAAAKGNTLLNYAGVKADMLPMVADRALSKQGKYLPGSHIPIISPSDLDRLSFDSLLVLPWNLINEIKSFYPDKKMCTAFQLVSHSFKPSSV